MGEAMAKTRDPETDLIAKNMRAFREAAGLTTEQVAKHYDIGIDSLRRYETGAVSAPFSVLTKLAEAYGHRLEDFVMDKPPKADLSGRPGVALSVLPGTVTDDVAARAIAQVQREIARINATMRSVKKSKK